MRSLRIRFVLSLTALALGALALCAARAPATRSAAAELALAPAQQAQASAANASSEAPAHAAPALLRRPVVIGASVSAGFGLVGELGAATRLADYLDQAILGTHDSATSCASSLLFQDPLGGGERQIEQALAAAPSIVFGLDFLFWFGHGMPLSEPQRLELLEHGLALLERLPCPLVIGDLPDVHAALGGATFMGQHMIVAAQIPEPQTLAQLNARILQWAAKHPNATVVPLARFLGDLQAGKQLAVRDNRWEPQALPRLLQKDLLHCSHEGTAAVVVLALDSLLHSGRELAPAELRLSAAELAKAVYDAKEPARQKRAKLREKAPAPSGGAQSQPAGK